MHLVCAHSHRKCAFFHVERSFRYAECALLLFFITLSCPTLVSLSYKTDEMKLFELTSGLIAAVVIALGVNHFVQNNTTPIEEESVVEELTVVKVWFEYTGPAFGQPGYDPHNPELYTLFEGDNEDDEPTCLGAEQVCSIRTEAVLSTISHRPIPKEEELEDMADDIDQGVPNSDLKFKTVLL